MYHLGSNSLWVDEILTARAASLDWTGIITEAFQQNSVPPLYFWLVHLVSIGFGSSEASLRLVSAVAGALTPPLMYVLMRELDFSRQVGIVAAGLLALNPLHLWFSQEARPYVLLTFFECAALCFAARAIKTNRPVAWAGCCLCLCLGFLTHTFAAMLLVIVWLWALLARPVPWPGLIAVTLGFLTVAAPFLIALSQRDELSHPPARASLLELPYAVYTYLAGYSFGPSTREIQNDGALTALRANRAEAGLTLGLLLAMTLTVVWSFRNSWMQLAILCVVPLIVVAIASRLTAFPFNVRYTLPSMVGALGLVALMARRGVPRIARYLLAATLALFIAADAQWFMVSRYWKEDSRSAADWFVGHLGNGDSVAVAPGYMVDPLEYYMERLPGNHHLEFLDFEAPGAILSAGLAVSREHHLVQPREIERAFIAASDLPVQRSTLVGFRLFARRAQ